MMNPSSISHGLLLCDCIFDGLDTVEERFAVRHQKVRIKDDELDSLTLVSGVRNGSRVGLAPPYVIHNSQRFPKTNRTRSASARV